MWRQDEVANSDSKFARSLQGSELKAESNNALQRSRAVSVVSGD